MVFGQKFTLFTFKSLYILSLDPKRHPLLLPRDAAYPAELYFTFTFWSVGVCIYVSILYLDLYIYKHICIYIYI